MPDDTTVKFATFVIGLAVVAIVVNAFFVGLADVGTDQQAEEDVILGLDQQGALAYSGPVSNMQVEQSLGTALRFNGANDSELTGGTAPDPNVNWTVTTWARLNDSVPNSSEMRLLQIGGWLYVDFNDTQWRVTYYERDDLQVHQASFNAPAPYNWTHLTIRENDTHLWFARNKTHVMTLSLASGGASVPNASNWNGSAEETRVFNATLSRSKINATYDQPTAPVDGGDEEGRVMYDIRPGETEVDIYWTGTDMTRPKKNVTIVDGFDGQPATEATAGGLLGGDWTFDDKTDTLSAVDGGSLDGAPVAFVAYTQEVGFLGGVVENAAEAAGSALALLAIGALVLAAREVMSF